ncbi:hypothetical protein [Bradyrhizobium diazoefficiens]|uniref:hypothetical protein n=1 Tax=Bradyrhizobium diazoefficiens TaxID=1355477 RepID=UPI0034939D91
MISADQMHELIAMLRDRSPLIRLTDMEARTVLELMQQRGWKITPPASVGANA